MSSWMSANAVMNDCAAPVISVDGPPLIAIVPPGTCCGLRDPDVSYARRGDVSIAYQVVGGEAPDTVSRP